MTPANQNIPTENGIVFGSLQFSKREPDQPEGAQIIS